MNKRSRVIETRGERRQQRTLHAAPKASKKSPREKSKDR
jgi:hypothetical protein